MDKGYQLLSEEFGIAWDIWILAGKVYSEYLLIMKRPVVEVYRAMQMQSWEAWCESDDKPLLTNDMIKGIIGDRGDDIPRDIQPT